MIFHLSKPSARVSQDVPNSGPRKVTPQVPKSEVGDWRWTSYILFCVSVWKTMNGITPGSNCVIMPCIVVRAIHKIFPKSSPASLAWSKRRELSMLPAVARWNSNTPFRKMLAWWPFCCNAVAVSPSLGLWVNLSGLSMACYRSLVAVPSSFQPSIMLPSIASTSRTLNLTLLTGTSKVFCDLYLPRGEESLQQPCISIWHSECIPGLRRKR